MVLRYPVQSTLFLFGGVHRSSIATLNEVRYFFGIVFSRSQLSRTTYSSMTYAGSGNDVNFRIQNSQLPTSGLFCQAFELLSLGLHFDSS